MAAHQEIHRYKAMHNLPDTPRTTVVACLIQHNLAMWAHCGDSRLYWMRGGQVLARTRDHSHVENLIAKGLVPPSERTTHPDRNKLYNCLGASTSPRVEISRRASLLPGDVMLLCSDGLWNEVGDEHMAQCLHAQTVVRAVPELLHQAVATAGPASDNATALAIMWQGSTAADGMPSQPSASMISTEMLAEDQVNSTIHGAGAPDPLEDSGVADVFDDDEIERAIAEIRGAIEKSTQLLTKRDPSR
jgi:protein phosphatase